MTGSRFLCLGAGAIGTYIGGSLIAAGIPVVFVERQPLVELLRKNGLKLNLPTGSQLIAELQVFPSVEVAVETGPFTACIYALKSFDTPAAVEALSSIAEILPPILCLSNGVENELALKAVLGEGKVISGTVTSAVGRIGPGEIILERLRGIGIESDHLLSVEISQAFNRAGLRAQLIQDGRDMKWSKLLTNLMTNATSAILNMAPSEILDHPALYRLEVAQLREALQVMRAQSIRTVNLPGTPVEALALIVRFLPLWLSRALLARAVSRGRGEKMPSLHIDLHSGRRESEVGYLNGAVVRYGDKFHVQTPVNRCLNEVLQLLAKGELDRSDYDHRPGSLLAHLEG